MFVSKELTLLLLAVYFFTHVLSKLLPMRILKLISHWMRWLTFACAFSLMLTFFNWSSRPDWVHFISGLAVWFIIETLYYKISIHFLNVSDMELFPKYKNDTGHNLWPINKRAFKIKELLRKEGFKSEETLKAQIVGHLSIRQAVFFNKDQTIRLNVLFIPNAKNEIQLFYSLFSLKSDGEYLITDNQNMPFGGFYPDHWTVNRFPVCHSLKKLLKKHQEVMKTDNRIWSQIEGDIRTKTNRLQLELEQKNREMGFLNESNQEDTHQISSEGCFRIWTEMWMLAYLGKTLS